MPTPRIKSQNSYINNSSRAIGSLWSRRLTKNHFVNLDFNNKYRKNIKHFASTYDDLLDISDFFENNNFLFCTGEINDQLVNSLINSILFLSYKDNNSSIKLCINSPGGSIMAGLALYDAIVWTNKSTNTISLGLAASMGAFLLASGTNGLRFSTPNTRIMIHQPIGGIQGNAVDIEIQVKELLYHRNNINYLLSKFTDQSLSMIESDTDRDKYMTPLEAKEYGIIDRVLNCRDSFKPSIKNCKKVRSVKKSNINWASFYYSFNK
ncbi:Clp protease (nucleomorph) [Bigelowiella natans]|uniref:ATP-dependent Clp protease proteolytic subunit n=2 Tax=Bigelowiella natans TaxID=227086 RepID=Q3LWG6_BIGNA|nr:Clp protease [Bigelowiella natans]ABA27199.1 Clp protease [Bigelowiella natans]|mmetsp:Transcript_12336/g.14587  ORF Transcript_12336/g.14587 Transcript_12336/m.14587 type:complete len:265 (-) Transcript_12336:1241-2035(-)